MDAGMQIYQVYCVLLMKVLEALKVRSMKNCEGGEGVHLQASGRRAA